MSEEKQDPKNRPFVERFLDLNEEMVEVHVPKFYEKLSDEMDSVIQGKIDEIIKVVARSFGAQKSELPFLIRKMSLEKTDNSGKKTPAPDRLEKGGPDGTGKPDWVEDELKKGGYA